MRGGREMIAPRGSMSSTKTQATGSRPWLLTVITKAIDWPTSASVRLQSRVASRLVIHERARNRLISINPSRASMAQASSPSSKTTATDQNRPRWPETRASDHDPRM